MRLVSVDCMRGNETLAKDIILDGGIILLRKGTKLKKTLISKIKDFDIEQVYIDDSISEGITPEEIISLEEKQSIIRDIKEEFDKVKDNLIIDAGNIKRMADTLADKFFDGNIIIDLMNMQTNDDYTYTHCLNVAILTTTLCNKLKMDVTEAKKVVVGALLHDVGKILIPKDILNKPSKLTEQEYNVIKGHSLLGYELLKENEDLDPVSKVAVLCHHERIDGSGYPLGKKHDLHIGAKIVATCDVFDALVSDRPYRKGYNLNEVCILLRKEKLDEEIKEAFENLIAFYPVGVAVLISNGVVGIVEQNFASDLSRPNVRGVYNVRHKKFYEEKICLREREELYIVSKLDGIPIIDNIALI